MFFLYNIVRSFVLILTRNNGSELKTSAWGDYLRGIRGASVWLYTLRSPASSACWLSGHCNAVVHDLGLHTVMKIEVMGVRVLLWSVGAAGVW